MLSLSGVSLRRGRKLLFENVTFQVHAGHRVGLVGANGSGKTSLFMLLLGELEADDGEVQINRDARIAHVSQQSPHGTQSALDHVMDGDEELRSLQAAIRQSEREEAAETLHDLYERMDQIDGFAAEARAARLLHGLGFEEEQYHSPVDEFSGGWRMRLNLARALMCRSDVLLLDEPTNHLDLPAILWLEQWLRRYRGSLLLVSHDRDFLDSVCTRIAHLERETIRLYSGNYSSFEEHRSAPLARQEAMYKRQQKEIQHLQAYVDRFRYKASKARQAQSRVKMLEKMKRIVPAHVDSPFHFRFDEPDRQPQHLAQLEEVSAGYSHPVLEGVDLLISAGDRIGLLGVNGAGKSTLVKALGDGSTLLDGRRTISRETRIGYFAQHQLDLLTPTQSPLEHLRALSPGDRESKLRRYLGGFGFTGDRIFDPVSPFSGGEKARLVLALMIRQRPNLLLLDEPTNHLDLDMRQALSMALAEYSGAIVVISHDRHLLRSVCDELLIVHNGGVARFDRSLDEYTAWLQEQQPETGPGQKKTARKESATQAARKDRRRQEAQRRLELKPFSDRVRNLEHQIGEHRSRLDRIDEKLADAGLYSDPGRRDELTGLMRDQAGLKSSIAKMESDWLEASEALEQAAGRVEPD
jgi:ATP-binding cassette subfamily F protein 3